MDDYYPGEIAAVINEWNQLHGNGADEPMEVSPEEFLGSGGEIL